MKKSESKTIKTARIESGISRKAASEILEIPLRTLENWESGINKPAPYVEKLVIEKLESIKERKNYYWEAKAYFGGDSPISLLFEKEQDRDEYVKTHKYCEENGKVKTEDVWDISGCHYGIFVEKKNGEFIDAESGEEL